jgi:prepilin peptidase CpaA
MSLVAVIEGICLMLFVVSLMGAAAQDLRTMRIANGFSLAIVALFAISSGAGVASGRLPVSSPATALVCATLVFLGGAAAFAMGAFGGGDVKLLAAASLFAGAGHVLDFLAITAVVGGVLGVASLAGIRLGQAAVANGAVPATRLQGSVPYGPAIAAGGLWVAASIGWS